MDRISFRDELMHNARDRSVRITRGERALASPCDVHAALCMVHRALCITEFLVCLSA